MFMLSTMNSIAAMLRVSCLTFLLTEDYGLSNHDSATKAAQLNLITDAFLIPCEFLMGVLLEKYGRKWFNVSSLFLVGSSLILQTFFHKVEPQLQIFVIMIGCGSLPLMMQTYLLDYVDPVTQGKLGAYCSVCQLLGGIIASTVAFQLDIIYSINFVYHVYGSFAILFGVLAIFLLKDYKK